ncbi:MAG TPA: hypothetical protein ENI59_00010 [Euryarchaeota archaeon]|nr:hypothetical protein [Euryarchaeota archaeon]
MISILIFLITGWALPRNVTMIPDPMNLDSLKVEEGIVLPDSSIVYWDGSYLVIKRKTSTTDSIIIKLGNYEMWYETWNRVPRFPSGHDDYYGIFNWNDKYGIIHYTEKNGQPLYYVGWGHVIELSDAQEDIVRLEYNNNSASNAADLDIWLTTSSGEKQRAKFGADGKVIFYSNENGHYIEFDAGTGANAGTITGSHGLKVGEVEEDSIRLSAQECIRDFSSQAIIIDRTGSLIRRVLNADRQFVVFDIDRFLFPADSVEIDSLKVHVYGTLLEGDTLQFRVDSCNNWTYDDGYHTTIETLIPGPLSAHNNLVLVVNRRYSKAEIGRYKYILYLIEPIDGSNLHVRHLTVYYKRWY